MSIKRFIKLVRAEKPDFLVDDYGRAYITAEMLFQSDSYQKCMELDRQQNQNRKEEEAGESEKPTCRCA